MTPIYPPEPFRIKVIESIPLISCKEPEAALNYEKTMLLPLLPIVKH